MRLPRFPISRNPSHPGFSPLIPLIGKLHEKAPTGHPLFKLAKLSQRYDSWKLLGRGAQGAVFLLEGKQRLTNLSIAKFAKESVNAQESLWNEVLILASLPCAAFPRLRGLLFRNGDLNGYIMEYRPGQTLEEKIRNGSIAKAEIPVIAKAVCRAVMNMLRKGILHRDLKPCHLFLTENGKVQILDLGLARQLRNEPLEGLSGTPLYASPEQFEGNGEKLTEKSDLFTLGLILYELVCGKPFFPDEKNFRNFSVFRKLRMMEPILLPDDCPPRIAGIIHRLIVENPRARADCDEVDRLLSE